MQMFSMVENNVIQTPLFDVSSVKNPQMGNKEFVREYTANLLRGAFPHLLK